MNNPSDDDQKLKQAHQTAYQRLQKNPPAFQGMWNSAKMGAEGPRSGTAGPMIKWASAVAALSVAIAVYFQLSGPAQTMGLDPAQLAALDHVQAPLDSYLEIPMGYDLNEIPTIETQFEMDKMPN